MREKTKSRIEALEVAGGSDAGFDHTILRFPSLQSEREAIAEYQRSTGRAVDPDAEIFWIDIVGSEPIGRAGSSDGNRSG